MSESPQMRLFLYNNLTPRDSPKEVSIKGICMLEIFWNLIPVNIYSVYKYMYIRAKTLNDYKGIALAVKALGN